MSKVYLTDSELHTRGDEIVRLLGLISDNRKPLRYLKDKSSYKYAIGVHTGSPLGNVTDLRFDTSSDNYVAQYYEVWHKVKPMSDRWDLFRAYLHVYESENPDSEVIALHCDPLEDVSQVHYLNKRVPHIHLSWLGDPLKHSHIALDRTYTKSVLGNVKNLTNAYRNAIDIVWNEILLPLSIANRFQTL